MKYNHKVTVVPGKSLRIVTLLVAVAADDVETADTPAVPCFAKLLTTEHMNLHRYLLEDVLFAEVGMQVLLCVAPTHPYYERYEAMHDALPIKVPRRSIGDVSYLQLNAIIVLHPQRSDLIGGVLAHDQMLHLLTGNGNEGIAYHFGPNFEKHITWKEIFFHCDTIQVWGNSPPHRNYYQVLHKIGDTPTRAALFNRFASEIDGDKASTSHDKKDVSPIPSSSTKRAGSNTPNGFKEIDDRRSYSRRIDSRKSNDSRRSDGRSDSKRSIDASKKEVGIEQLLLFEHESSHLHDITS